MSQGSEFGVLLNSHELRSTLVIRTEDVDGQPSGLLWREFGTIAHALDRLIHHMRWPSSAVAGAIQVCSRSLMARSLSPAASASSACVSLWA
jgi:hypothetical protein